MLCGTKNQYHVICFVDQHERHPSGRSIVKYWSSEIGFKCRVPKFARRFYSKSEARGFLDRLIAAGGAKASPAALKISES